MAPLFFMIFLQREEHYIIGTFSYIGIVEAIVVATHIAFSIEQYELLRMYKVICAAIARAGLNTELMTGIVVDSMFIAGEKPPLIVVGIEAVGIGTEYLEAIVTGIYSDGYELHNGIELGLLFRVFAKAGLQQLYALADAWAYRRAAGEDEINDHHFAGQVFVHGYLFAELVGELYIGRMVVECIGHLLTSGLSCIHLLYSVIAGHLYHAFGKMIDHKIAK